MGMKKPKSNIDKSLASSTSRSSFVEIKKKSPSNISLLRVLRPKVYIIDSSSFKQLVQELTGKEPPNTSQSLKSPSSSSSLTSSPPLLPSILTVEDIPTLSEDNSPCQILPEMSPDANSIMSPPYDMDYVPFPLASHKGFDFSYDDIESWLMEMDPMTSVSTSHEMERVDINIYDYDFS